eukprot:Nitzschia sp. Nitz4//scaffold81_size91200//84479//86307//NITZ4_005003-RA/size91200-snap-gene-0.26-mRNA-1//1//CDS//3329558761//3178//frame0
MPAFLGWFSHNNNGKINCCDQSRTVSRRDQTNSLDSSDSLSDSSDIPAHWWEHIYWQRPATLIEDLLTMGNCLATGGGPAHLIENPDGDEKEFHKRFLEDRVLGEGEFGVVKLVHDMSEKDESKATLACKTLRKGVVFKDNTLYSPLKPEVLQGEIEMLRTLNGNHFCMAVKGVYETPRTILLVTEFCGGGEMMEYISKQEDDLRTDDVSRIAFQLLDAVNHCAQHNIIHRDIKPENVMFQSPTPGSDLRLIDFGSGTNKVVEGVHTTFAGSAFYISPEMFQRTYTQKTDVWSAGVTLYVLVAGYPADVLQKAFNRLQSSNRVLRELPNLPDNMPDSYYDLLEGLLVYRYKKRKTAGECLSHEFVEFHKSAFSFEQIAAEAHHELPNFKNGSAAQRKTQSVALRGSVGRHTLFLDYQNYQRSLTTLLATLLDKKALSELIKFVDEFLAKSREDEGQVTAPLLGQRLDVVNIRNLKSLLKEHKHDQVLAMIDKLPGSSSYDTFAYDIALLKEFSREDKDDKRLTNSMRAGGRRRMGSGMNSSLRGASLRGSFRGGSMFGRKGKKDDMDSSIHSAGSLRGRQSFLSS